MAASQPGSQPASQPGKASQAARQPAANQPASQPASSQWLPCRARHTGTEPLWTVGGAHFEADHGLAGAWFVGVGRWRHVHWFAVIAAAGARC